MRSRNANDAISVCLIAGTEVVLIALDIDSAHREGLLGFSIWRRPGAGGDFKPLLGGRRFRGVPTPEGGVPLSEVPLQDFLWGDYVVDPGVEYVYRVAGAYGSPGAIEHRHPVEVAVRTEHPDEGMHGIYFNRGVAASQGYVRRFGDYARWYRRDQFGRTKWSRFVTPSDVPNHEAHAWLSRGLGEAMETFIRRAQHDATRDGPTSRFELRAAVYELTDAKIIRAFVDVLESGADVQVVHHAAKVSSRKLRRSPGVVTTVEYDDPARDPISYRNSEVRQEIEPDSISKAALAAVDSVGVRSEASQARFEAMLIPRINTTIQHNKFIILLKDKQPVEVWTGSTNLTEGGIYGQSNVGQVVRDPKIALQFLDYWERLKDDPTTDAVGGDPAGGFADWIGLQFPDLSALPEKGETAVLFSPRPSEQILNWYAELFGSAKSSVHFTTAFTVAEPFLEQAVSPPVSEDAVRYLLMESIGGRLREPHERMRVLEQNRIAWGDRLGRISGRPANGEPQLQLEEALTGLNSHVNYMHTKYLLVDPLTDDPIVVSGSANFSRASTLSNDENMLIYRGQMGIADIFLSEFMRLFRHFESRNRRNLLPPEELAAFEFLIEDDSWSSQAFTTGTPSFLERRLFANAFVEDHT